MLPAIGGRDRARGSGELKGGDDKPRERAPKYSAECERLHALGNLYETGGGEQFGIAQSLSLIQI